jgi:thiol-disulfide isomerase/thioredoxin
MTRRHFLRYAAMLAGVGVASAWQGSVQQAGAKAIFDPLFAQRFPDATGREFALEQWLGKPVVVNFWATWCPPCVKEMPDLEALHKKYDGIQFLGLGIDTASNMLAFADKVKVSYPLLVLGHGGISLMRELGNKNGGLPFTVVFDAQGRVHSKILGQVKPDALEQTLRTVLG